MKSIVTLLSVFGLMLCSCNSKDSEADAFGSFEMTETIISAEASGKLMQFNIHEGDEVEAGQIVGYLDSTQVHLTKLQLIQNQRAVLSGRPDIGAQLEALERELDNAISDKKRIENLVKGEVASQKQLDDANARIAVLQSKIDAQKSLLTTSTSTLNEQAGTIGLQLAQVEDQLQKCRIVNPVKGTVLSTYVNPFEMATVGKPLYKIADLGDIQLRAYITNDQFSIVKVGQPATVMVDSGDGKMKSYQGTISWISSKGEFTPKTVQTKDERANLVYAIKIRVKNDGFLKMGMYGEVKFN